MRKLIIIAILLVAILAPLEMLGFLRRGFDQIESLASSSEVQNLVSKFKIELPNLGDSLSNIFSRIVPKFGVGTNEVR